MKYICILSKDNLDIAKDEALIVSNAKSHELKENILIIESEKEKLYKRLAYTHRVLKFAFCCKKGDLLNEIKNFETIDHKLYPNPVQHAMILELADAVSDNAYLILSNTNSQELLTQPITKARTEIDISHLPSGIYIVKVWNDKDVMVQKVIKQ